MNTKERVIKKSKQRDLVMEAVKSTNLHPTAEEIYAVVRSKNPNISLSTVYRNLNLLTELGQIRKVDIGEGGERFDGDVSDHYHMQCVRCGRVYDLPVTSFPNPLLQMDTVGDFKILSHALFFKGICKDCEKE